MKRWKKEYSFTELINITKLTIYIFKLADISFYLSD